MRATSRRRSRSRLGCSSCRHRSSQPPRGHQRAALPGALRELVSMREGKPRQAHVRLARERRRPIFSMELFKHAHRNEHGPRALPKGAPGSLADVMGGRIALAMDNYSVPKPVNKGGSSAPSRYRRTAAPPRPRQWARRGSRVPKVCGVLMVRPPDTGKKAQPARCPRPGNQPGACSPPQGSERISGLGAQGGGGPPPGKPPPFFSSRSRRGRRLYGRGERKVE